MQPRHPELHLPHQGRVQKRLFTPVTRFLLRYRVDELTDSCHLTLPNIDPTDSGPYQVIFPGRFTDKFNLILNVMEWDNNNFWQSVGIATFLIILLFCFVIVFLRYRKSSFCQQIRVKYSKAESQT